MSKVPYTIEPSWFLETGKDPKLYCEGCGEQVEDSYGFNTQHEILDCLKVLKDRIEKLENG